MKPEKTPRRLGVPLNLALGVALASLMTPGLAEEVGYDEQPWSGPEQRWIGPGQGGILDESLSFDTADGKIGIFNAEGSIDMAGHPFFEPLSENGRACVTCHQPADAMGLSLASIRERWDATQGADPLFSVFDGANCPNLTRGVESSHSLLLERGLVRVALPWPPRGPDGEEIEPEFSLEVVRDPSGCNTDPVYG